MNYSAFFIAFSSRKKIENALTANNFIEIQICEGTYYTAEEQALPACMVYVNNENDISTLIEFGREFRRKSLCTYAYSKGYGSAAWFIDFSGHSYDDVLEQGAEISLSMHGLELFVKKAEETPELVIFYEETEETIGYEDRLSASFDFDCTSVQECGFTNLGR